MRLTRGMLVTAYVALLLVAGLVSVIWPFGAVAVGWVCGGLAANVHWEFQRQRWSR